MNLSPALIDTLELLPYQADFAANSSRFKIGLWARQTGKDHTATAEAVLDCLQTPGTTWIIVAASERQALESLAKARDWAAILKLQIDQYNEAPANVPYSVARVASTEIRWSNGSRLIALPANPSTIRGYSANLILTEFAFHENPETLWRAIYPTISNPLRGGVKKLRIISTPNGLNNKFAQLWNQTTPQFIGHTASSLDKSQGNPFAISNHLPEQFLNQASDLSQPTCGGHGEPSARHEAVPFLLPRPLGGPQFAKRKSFSGPQTCGGLGEPLGWGEGVPANTSEHALGLPRSGSEISNFKSLSSSASSASNPLSLFFRSRVTIHDAIRSGLPLDPVELQAGLNDPEAWAQEYLCEFMDNATVLLPYDLIETCESPLATELSNPQSLTASAIPGGHRPELFAGLDFARKNHLTVLWILEKLPASVNVQTNSPRPLGGEGQGEGVPTSNLPTQPLFLTREVLCLRNASTPEQLELLRPRLQLCRKVCLDYTGPGVGLGDFLHKEMGSRVELCPFTAPFKAELFPRLAAAMESRQLLIPIGRDIREDLHSIYRTTTHSGTILYRAHATPDGHADRTTALALAVRAAQTGPAHACAQALYPIRRFRGYSRGNCYPLPPETIAIIY